MCGINGIISKCDVDNINERVHSMNDAIQYRGPDAHGVTQLNVNICFGHRRLAIIDLDERSNQPMSNVDGSLVISFNGEIYNYKDIKSELNGKYVFSTNSDTEVILASVQVHGIDWFLNRANGMFAFSIYDRRNNSIYLARDRFGIKPLYYTVTRDKIIFSSEIKGILKSGLIDAIFNENAIDEYLGNRYVREPFTFFDNIFQVKSSTYLKVDVKTFKIKEKKYWELPVLNFDVVYNEEEIIKQTNEEIVKAVSRWSISDVNVGSYLSGGLDSSLITALLNYNKRKNKINTYTIGFPEKGYNEFEFSEIVSNIYNTKHNSITVSRDSYMNQWEAIIKYKDAPLAVPNEIPLALMSNVLCNDISVVMSGEGADELFGGYGRIFRSPFDYHNHINSSNESFYSYFIHKYEYISRHIRDKSINCSSPLRIFHDELQSSSFSRYKNEENVFRFFHTNHINGLLNRLDTTTMQASVEARTPFLDHELIEYVYNNIPYELKLKWNKSDSKIMAKNMFSNRYSEILDTPKYILKKVSEQYLPKSIIYRKKVGFPVPLTNWFQELEETAHETLYNAYWLRSGAINNLIYDIKSKHHDRSGQLLWMFINVELFRKAYFNTNWRW
jgi:asparagine synthase (glutamine-hydrolysing)